VTPFSISDNLLKSLYYFAFFSSLYGRAIAIRFFSRERRTLALSGGQRQHCSDFEFSERSLA
jgi:hypothetical protein